MGHGDRWTVVGDGADAKSTLGRYLPHILQSGTAISGSKRRFVWPAKDGEPEEAVVAAPTGIVLQADPFILCVISLMQPSAGAPVAVTAYPAPRDGIASRLLIHEVEETCLGLEGWIHAATPSGVAISFFAADYFVHPERYTADTEVDVQLSGLAYALHAAFPHRFTIDLPELDGSLAGRGKPIEISTDDAAILLPLPDWEPFDYAFQGPVTRVRRLDGPPFAYLAVTVARAGDDDLDILVLAGDRIVDGEYPKLGSHVAGHMCLMGRIADFAWPGA